PPGAVHRQRQGDRPVPDARPDPHADRGGHRPRTGTASATDRRPFDGLQPRRPGHHDRGGAVPGRVVGEEVRATADVLTPGGSVGPDSPDAFVRNTAVMSVGTAFSRVTGYLRLAAMAYALG